MQNKTPIQQGWDFAIDMMGANIAGDMGEQYVNAVDTAIKKFEDNINNHAYRNSGVKQLQGYMLEEWAGGTHNVEAAAAGSPLRAEVLGSTKKDSVDVRIVQDGKTLKNYSAKSYATGEKTAKEQAGYNKDTGLARYHGQGRLVPTDQLDDAKTTAHNEYLRNKTERPKVSKAYKETEEQLTDTISSNDGISSKPVTRKELDKIAKESKKEKFNAKSHGITSNDAIKPEYVLKQALKAGYTAAAITIAIQLIPEIFKAIDHLVKTGKIDIEEIKRVGTKGISAGATGFLSGTIASCLAIMNQKGAFAKEYKALEPEYLGILTVLVLQTAKNGILLAAGKISARQMGDEFVDTLFVSGGYLLGTKIGNLVAEKGVGSQINNAINKGLSELLCKFLGDTVSIELPVVGFLLGSLIGAAFSAVYDIGKKKLISFCVDTGFTCFGLVEQNYELPEEVLHEMGIETVSLSYAQIDTADISEARLDLADIQQTDYETIEITELRRGVIGVNKIGYVVNN